MKQELALPDDMTHITPQQAESLKATRKALKRVTLLMAQFHEKSGNKQGQGHFASSHGVAKNLYTTAFEKQGQTGADIAATTEMAIRLLHGLVKTYQNHENVPGIPEAISTLEEVYEHSTLPPDKRIVV